jgi:threonine aldolase
MQQFASDNYSGICPEAFEAMAAANPGGAPAYGEDAWTARAADAFRTLFDTHCEVFFVFNGTAANSLALASLCQSYHSVICTDSAHVETDECGAPEFFSNGSKLLVAPTVGGKLTPEAVRAMATNRGDIHFPKPRVVTITQATETGQLYSIADLQALSATCRELGLSLHMDGARFANAVVFLGCSPAAISCEAGVHALSFGFVKNGGLGAEAIVFFDESLAEIAAWRRKRAGHLQSKGRFLAAQLLALLENRLWLENAHAANAAAAIISQGAGGRLLEPVEGNQLFLRMSAAERTTLRAQGFSFYDQGEDGARMVTAWDSKPEDCRAMAKAIANL